MVTEEIQGFLMHFVGDDDARFHDGRSLLEFLPQIAAQAIDDCHHYQDDE